MTRSLAASENLFRAAIAATVGIEPDRFDRPGTTMVSSEDRRESRLASAYAIGAHVIVWCDPAVMASVADLASDAAALDVTTMESWAAKHGAEYLGGAFSHLIEPAELPALPGPEGASWVRLDRDRAPDRGLIAELIDVSDPDDADAAELEMDDLDPHIVGLLDGDGHLAACAGERPWDVDERFADIGVLVRADQRKLGWGRSAVARLCREVLEEDRIPLYRCNWDPPASRSLALGLGFTQVSSLAAVVVG